MKRFYYAFSGCMTLIKKDAKFLLHLLIALAVLIAGCYYQLSAIEWIVIILAIGSVLAFEAINTALEYAIDLVTDDFHILAKHAKDVAAFSVLIAAITAAIIGMLIFIPKIF